MSSHDYSNINLETFVNGDFYGECEKFFEPENLGIMHPSDIENLVFEIAEKQLILDSDYVYSLDDLLLHAIDYAFKCGAAAAAKVHGLDVMSTVDAAIEASDPASDYDLTFNNPSV